MPLDKSQIRKGTFLVGGACAADGTMVTASRHERDQLRRQFPQFENVLQAAGLSPQREEAVRARGR